MEEILKMDKIGIRVILLCLMALFVCPPVMAENSWEFVKEQDGLKRYQRDVEGSKFKEYKAVTMVNANMAQVGAVFRDILSYPKWMASISDAGITRIHNENDMDIYFVLDFPWPATDRDTVLMTRTTIDMETSRVVIRTKDYVDPAVPEKKDLVRIPYLLQYFTMDYVDTDKTEVSYSVHLEAGGNLPASAVELDLKNAPFKSLKNLRAFVHEDKYWKADPMDDINYETTKVILGVNLKKYMKDEALVKLLLSDKAIVAQLVKNGHSDIGRKKNADIIVKAYVQSPLFKKRIQNSKYLSALSQMASNRDLFEALLHDDGFINLIMESGKTGMTDQIIADIVNMINMKSR